MTQKELEGLSKSSDVSCKKKISFLILPRVKIYCNLPDSKVLLNICLVI